MFFFDGTNGAQPHSPLLAGRDGAFYGTTISGGDSNDGTIFRITKDGAFTTIASFVHTNGAGPVGALVQTTDGFLYGLSERSSFGKIFRVTTNGDVAVVAAFDPLSNPSQGFTPWGGISQAKDGALYGTTYYGGDFNKGTVFRVTTNGELSTIASFADTNGANPYATVIQGSDGALYGTTSTGGSLGGGNVYRIVFFSHMLPPEPAGAGWNIRFSGVSGTSYRLMRAIDLSGSWTTLTNLTLGPSQTGQYIDNNPPQGQAYYRTVSP